jgi:hypothetical protein
MKLYLILITILTFNVITMNLNSNKLEKFLDKTSHETRSCENTDIFPCLKINRSEANESKAYQECTLTEKDGAINITIDKEEFEQEYDNLQITKIEMPGNDIDVTVNFLKDDKSVIFLYIFTGTPDCLGRLKALFSLKSICKDDKSFNYAARTGLGEIDGLGFFKSEGNLKFDFTNKQVYDSHNKVKITFEAIRT